MPFQKASCDDLQKWEQENTKATMKELFNFNKLKNILLLLYIPAKALLQIALA